MGGFRRRQRQRSPERPLSHDRPRQEPERGGLDIALDARHLAGQEHAGPRLEFEIRGELRLKSLPLLSS